MDNCLAIFPVCLLVQCHHSLAFKSIVSKHFFRCPDSMGQMWSEHTEGRPSDREKKSLENMSSSPGSPSFNFSKNIKGNMEQQQLVVLFCSWIINIEKVLTSLKKFSRNDICKKKKIWRCQISSHCCSNHTNDIFIILCWYILTDCCCDVYDWPLLNSWRPYNNILPLLLAEYTLRVAKITISSHNKNGMAKWLQEE